MNDFCPTCSTYLAGAVLCPTCGEARPQAPATAVEIMGVRALDGEVQAGAVFAGGVLAAALIARADEQGPRFGRLVGIDVSDLSEKWRRHFPEDLFNPPLAAEAERIYFATQSADPLYKNASLHALDADSGKALWMWEPGMRALSAPTLAAGRLWTVGDGGRLWAVDAATGKPGEPIQLQGPRHILPPAIAGDRIYVPTRGPLLLAVDAKSGEIVWRYEHQASAWAGTPLLVADLVIVPYTNGDVAALAAATGKLRWQQAGEGRLLPPLLGDGERIYVGEHRGLRALSASEGETLWQLESERKITAKPMLLGRTLVVAGQDHFVRGLNPQTGEELWRWQGERRFEAEPVYTAAGIALLDSGDTLTMLAIPQPKITVEQALAQGDWREAASLLAAEEDMAGAAALLEEHDDLFASAEIWAAANDLEKAVALYERTDTELGWERAAALHERLGDWVLRAAALKERAELRDDAEAWARAQRAYQDAGLVREAAASWREVCRLRRHPFVRIEVLPEMGFVKANYNVLRLIVHNEGWNVAAMLSARARSDAFSGEDMQSQIMGNLAQNLSRELRLGLLPTSSGKVPLTLEVSFLLGPNGEPHEVSQRVFVDVASHESERQSSADLAQQLTEGFNVIERESFRRDPKEVQIARLNERLSILKERLWRQKLRRTELGMRALVEDDMAIQRTEDEIDEVEGEIDELHGAG